LSRFDPKRLPVKYVKCSDEHGVIDDPKGVLKINEAAAMPTVCSSIGV
jgi:hypothetical protein